MRKKINIACLPVAGIENPYQYLMINGLKKNSNISAFNGVNNKFLGIIKTWLNFKPDFIHFDWIHSYYIRRNKFMTYCLLPSFIIQILIIYYFTETKIVWTMHNVLPHNTKNIQLNKFVRKFFANKCNWIRVFSENTVVKSSRYFGIKKEKFKVLPEGDYVDYYPNKISRKKSREFFNFKKNEIILLYLGFIRPYKGIENLISCFDKIENNNYRLMIIGVARDQSYLSKLNKQINSSVKRKKIVLKNCFVKNSDLQKYYNASDLVVLPFNKIENSGSVIMAMGFSKPIIAPNMGALKQRLSNQKELLYDNLLLKLEEISTFNNEKLKYIGSLNKQSLKKFKWDDFSYFFT
jgi:glycosyltransferase involved in cell wall biosynthesis